MPNKKQEADKTARNVLMIGAYHDHAKGLNTHAFFKVHNIETSNDLVQDTFTKTWSYLVRGGKIDIMRGFLYHILKELIVDEYRKKKTMSLDVLMENGFDMSSDRSKRVEDIFDGGNAALLIGRLPKKYQKIMRMRHVQELSLKEIALITGQSKNTVTVFRNLFWKCA
ncbi:MAG: RNA polymerase sigma factor [Minisyncoccota bacterium]